MNFEHPLTSLVFITSIVSVVLTFVASYSSSRPRHGDDTLWWKLSLIITCGTLAGAIIPELVKVFTSTDSRHVKEVVTCLRAGRRLAQHPLGLRRGQLLRVLARASRSSRLMGGAYYISNMGRSGA
jgi:K(+)-stimulated pyrophosphate-energized sodium pump